VAATAAATTWPSVPASTAAAAGTHGCGQKKQNAFYSQTCLSDHLYIATTCTSNHLFSSTSLRFPYIIYLYIETTCP
jgi:hypothetical protein